MDDIGEILRKNYKIIIPLVLIVFIVIGIMIVKSFVALLPENARENLERVSQQRFKTIKELLEYYECEYVSLERVNENNYIYKLTAKLRLPPYEGSYSNEEFYMNLLNDIAYFYDYQNFILADDTQDLKIKVTCENAEIKSIIVNGIEDYFNKKKEELALREFKEIEETPMVINSTYIQDLINNNWNSDVTFGTKESIYDGYDIYFDEGVEVRKLQGKVYNIIFKDKYPYEIINNLTVNSTQNEIGLELGVPTFKDAETGTIGYKGRNIYVFFSEGQVSVYRREVVNVNELLSLLDKFKKEEIDILELMNELTYLWPDYNEYIYDASSLYISYPLKGFEIKVNYENERGIIFYNNFNAKEYTISSYLDSEDFKAYLQEDYVYKTEVNRLNAKKDLSEKVEDISNDFYESNNYDIVLDKTEDEEILKVYFISKDGSNPNRELNDSFTSYAWVSDNHFIFGKTGKGLYCYDLTTGDVQTLFTGKGNYNITKSDFGMMIYDNIEQRFEF